MIADDLPLHAVQEWFLHVTTDAESVHAGLKRHANIVDPDELERVMRPGPRETALDRLSIYHHSYFSRLTECLADDYPALRFALGERAFDDLCREYIDAYPSREPNLNGFGRHLACFIEERRRDLGRFVAELARLEWSLVEVLHARAPERIVPATLEAIPEGALASVRFDASPAVRMFSFEYPVNAFLQAFFEERRPSRPERSPTSVVTVRTGYQIWRLERGPVAAQLLRRLIAGERLGPALDGIDARPDQVQGWFRDWTASGVFERVVAGE